MAGRRFALFGEDKVQDYLQSHTKALERKVEIASDEFILGVGEEQYVQKLVADHRVQELVMDFDKVWADKTERMFNITQHPKHIRRRLRRTAMRQFKRLVVLFYIPFNGDTNLLERSPISRLVQLPDARIEDKAVRIEYVAFEKKEEDPERINRNVKSALEDIKHVYEQLQRNVERYNERMEQRAREVFQRRKEKVQGQHDLMNALEVPIREKSSPDAFTIPEPDVAEPIRVEHPQVQERDSERTYRLGDDVYRRILNLVHSAGQMLERSPVFAGMPEESLRDILLAVLEPRFEGSATGETFNRSGKTDILLRHEGENVFVAECKFWGGKKQLSDTIDQLLGYLTWRESKTALVVFVDRKDFTPILQKARDAAKGHDCFEKEHDPGGEAYRNFTFHLPEDSNREIRLALQLFHLPRK